ncbi:TIM44-like domain-containing protein [Candidatus Saccharibacteria bacterium]|nr:TIM44-like domain-containing protein [Candidatus Saccharibacteria bacterium]
MKRKHLVIIAAILVGVLGLFLAFGGDSYADFGDFSGGSDFDFDFDYDDYDYDYGGSSSYSSGSSYSSSGGDLSGAGFIFGLMLGIFIGAAIGSVGRKKSSGVAVYSSPAVKPVLRSMEEYKTIDPDFDENAFREKVSNLYVKFQNAWQAKKLDPLRPYLTDVAYGQYDRQLDKYRKAERTNKIEKIAVMSVDLKGFRQNNGKDEIVARVRTRITDYVVDDKTGKIVEGSDKVEKFMEYEWSLERTTGVTTTTEDGTSEQRCPNCGGKININKTTECPYCRFVVTTDKFGWLVSTIKGISQRTGK